MGITFDPKDATHLIEIQPNCYVSLNGLKYSGKWLPAKAPNGRASRKWKGDEAWVTPELAKRASNADYNDKGQANRPWGRVIGQRAIGVSETAPADEPKTKKRREVPAQS